MCGSTEFFLALLLSTSGGELTVTRRISPGYTRDSGAFRNSRCLASEAGGYQHSLACLSLITLQRDCVP